MASLSRLLMSMLSLRVPLTGTARIHGTHKQRSYAQASCAAGETPIGAPRCERADSSQGGVPGPPTAGRSECGPVCRSAFGTPMDTSVGRTAALRLTVIRGYDAPDQRPDRG